MTQQRNPKSQEREPYRPAGVVHLDAATIERLAKDGLEFRREIEKRAAPMFVPTPSADARSRLR